MKNFEAAAREHLPCLDGRLDALRADYADDTMVVIRDLLPDDLAAAMAAEARMLLERASQRRDVVIEQSGGTPRAYQSVGRDAIRAQGAFIPAFFDSPAILDFLGKIVGERLYRVPYAPEEFIINSQCKPGDTHGWHWDDYSFALIWVVDEPDVLSGGRVEFVPRIGWDKNNTDPLLRRTLACEAIRSLHVPAGCCYLLRETPFPRPRTSSAIRGSYICGTMTGSDWKPITG